MSSDAVLELPVAGKGALLVSGRSSYSDEILGKLNERIFNTVSDITPFHENLEDDDQPSVLSRDNTIYFYDFLSKLTLTPSQKDILALSYYTGFDEVISLNNFGTSFSEDDDELEEEQKSNWGNWGASATWTRQWFKNFYSTMQVTSSSYFSEFKTTQTLFSPAADEFSETELSELEVDDLVFDNEVKDKTLRIEANWQASAQHKLDFGFSYTKPSIDFELENFGLNSEEFESDSVIFQQSAGIVSGYFEDFWQPTAKTRLTIGLRTNYYNPLDKKSLVDAFDWEPRTVLEYSLSENFRIKAAWGRYHQYILQFGDEFQFVSDDISWVLADRDTIQPGFSEHRIVGFQIESQNLLFDFEFYHKKLSGIFDGFNYRQFVPRDDSFDPFQQHPGSATGFDTHIRKKAGSFTGWLSYSFSRVRVQIIEEENKTIRYPTNQETPHNLKLVGNYAIEKWNFSATWQFVSGKPYSEPEVEQFNSDDEVISVLRAPELRNAQRLPSTHRLDLSITRDFTNRLFSGKAGFSIFNTYNRKNVWYRYFTVNNGILTPVDVHVFSTTPSLFLTLHF